MLFDSKRALVEKFVVFLDGFETVVGPVERKVLIDLVDEGL